jgi:hypothetical protein
LLKYAFYDFLRLLRRRLLLLLLLLLLLSTAVTMCIEMQIA